MLKQDAANALRRLKKSVNDSLSGFERFLLEEDFYNANFCLQTWRMHSRELDIDDEAEYKALKKRLEDASIDKAVRKAKKN